MMQSEGAFACRKPIFSAEATPPNWRNWPSLKPVLTTHNLPSLEIKEPS